MKIDLSYLKEMSGGDQQLVVEMIDIFKEQVGDFGKEMEELLSKKDYLALGKLAHKAKSSISIMGLNELSKDLKTLENLAREGKQPDIYPVLIEKFKKETNDAVTDLDEILQNLESYF
jgi:HPt (histidine-containing phosphotransfer) domain-containing protein